jgi:hypothetical protein
LVIVETRVTHYLPVKAFRLLFAGLAIAPSLAAQPQVELSYVAAAGCPSEQQFVAAVSARGADFKASDSGPGPRRLEVEIRQQTSGFAGELRVHGAGGPSTVRRVDDQECAGVVEGLAVVTAIALGAPAEEPAAAQTTAPAAASAAKEPAPAAAAPATAVEPTRRLRASSFDVPPESMAVQQGTLHFDQINNVTLSAGAQFGMVPGVALPRFDLDYTVANFVTPPGASSYLVGPLGRVRVGWLGPATHDGAGYSTTVSGFSAGAGIGSALTYDSQGLAVLLSIEWGLSLLQLETKSDDGTFTRRKQAGLGHAEMGIDGQYNFGILHAVLRLGGRFQVGDLSAQRPDGSALFDAGLLSGYATAGFGLHF